MAIQRPLFRPSGRASCQQRVASFYSIHSACARMRPFPIMVTLIVPITLARNPMTMKSICSLPLRHGINIPDRQAFAEVSFRCVQKRHFKKRMRIDIYSTACIRNLHHMAQVPARRNRDAKAAKGISDLHSLNRTQAQTRLRSPCQNPDKGSKKRMIRYSIDLKPWRSPSET